LEKDAIRQIRNQRSKEQISVPMALPTKGDYISGIRQQRDEKYALLRKQEAAGLCSEEKNRLVELEECLNYVGSKTKILHAMNLLDLLEAHATHKRPSQYLEIDVAQEYGAWFIGEVRKMSQHTRAGHISRLRKTLRGYREQFAKVAAEMNNL
jgi:hypothetical protein